MDIERDNNPAIREVLSLMRLLTNLNAGGMLALCLWLAWAAMEYNQRHVQVQSEIRVHGCGCTLNAITDWSGHINVAENSR